MTVSALQTHFKFISEGNTSILHYTFGHQAA